MSEMTMKLEITLLMLWYCLIEELEAKGYCTFPNFLWQTGEQDESRKWWSQREQSHISNDAPVHHEITVRGKDIMIKYMAGERCGRHKAQQSDCYRIGTVANMWCLSEEPNGKYRIQIQENGKLMFSCMKFVKINLNVVLIHQARSSQSNEDRLCYEESLYRDPWPWIAASLTEWVFCPLEGGFDFRSFMANDVEVCPKEWRPSRLESECIPGEGIVFYFPRSDCQIFGTKKREQRFYCWGWWTEDIHLFVLFGTIDRTPRFILRLPRQANSFDEFSGYLYLSPVAPVTSTGQAPQGVVQYRLNFLRSEPGTCFDVSRVCRDHAAAGRCLSPALHRYGNYCKRSCGLCEFAPSPNIECRFPEQDRGAWVLFHSDGREEVSIGEGDMRFSTLGRFICKSKHWNMDFYKVMSTFNNGCRPRYSCIHLSQRGQLLTFRLSRSSQADKSFTLCQFDDDPQPLGGKIRSSANKVMLPMSSMFYANCGLNLMAQVHLKFTGDVTCDGILSDLNPLTCDRRSSLTLEFHDTCNKTQETKEFQCSALVRLQKGVQFLVTRQTDTAYFCWVVHPGSAMNFYRQSRIKHYEATGYGFQWPINSSTWATTKGVQIIRHNDPVRSRGNLLVVRPAVCDRAAILRPLPGQQQLIDITTNKESLKKPCLAVGDEAHGSSYHQKPSKPAFTKTHLPIPVRGTALLESSTSRYRVIYSSTKQTPFFDNYQNFVVTERTENHEYNEPRPLQDIPSSGKKTVSENLLLIVFILLSIVSYS